MILKKLSNFFTSPVPDTEVQVPVQQMKKYGDDRVALVLQCSGMGDCLFAIPVLKKMVQRFSGSSFDLFTHHPDLFRRCPYVQNVYQFDDPALGDYLLTAKLFELDKLNHWEFDTMDFISIPAGVSQLSFREKQLEYFPQEEDCADAYDVVLNTSVTWPTRTWKLENWQRLAHVLVAQGLTVAVVGKDVDLPGADMPKYSFPLAGCVDLVNRLSLDQTYFTIKKSGLFVSCQNGLSVLAGATDVDMIVLGMSIEWSKRAVYRQEDPHYKIAYVSGTCGIYCCTDCRLEQNQCPLPEYKLNGEFKCIPSYEVVEKAVLGKLSARRAFKQSP